MYFGVPTGQTMPALTSAAALEAYDPASYAEIHAVWKGSVNLRQNMRGS